MISRREMLIGTAAAAGVMAGLGPAAARAAWPARTVTVVVPFAAGGTTDIVGRIVAERLQDRLKQSFVVENRGGGGGSIGTEAVGRAAPDGHTVLQATASSLTYSPHVVRPQNPLNPLDIVTPVGLTFAADHVVVVRKDFPADNLKDFVAHAAARPGVVTAGSGGPGSGAHIFAELFQRRTGIKMLHVPYKGSGPALNDLTAGAIDAMFDALPSALGQIKGGTVRALAVTGSRRSPLLPNVPTVGEAGVSDYVMVAWGGILAPRGTPAEIVGEFNAALRTVLDDEDVKKRFLQMGLEAASSTTEEFGERIATEFDVWGQVIREAGIQHD